MRRLRVETPASSANLGPGFDTVAVALDIVNILHVEIDEGQSEVSLRGEPSIDPVDNLVCRAYRLFGEDLKRPLPGARFEIDTQIPIGRGMGSSAACIVAGLKAAASAAESQEADNRILDLAMRIEGHPDNAAAALLGGLVVTMRDGDSAHALRIAEAPSLEVALFVPREQLLTAEARYALPESVPLPDAVFDLSRLACLVASFGLGRWDLLGLSMEDRLHQPYRERLIPALPHVIEAAREARALGAALSGAGPSVLAFTPAGGAERIAKEMEACARDHGWAGRGLTTRVRPHGATVQEE